MIFGRNNNALNLQKKRTDTLYETHRTYEIQL